MPGHVVVVVVVVEVLLYGHTNRRYEGREPRTAPSAFTQLLSPATNKINTVTNYHINKQTTTKQPTTQQQQQNV